MTLIDTAAIASDLGVTRAYATDRVTKRPDFPPPAIRLSRKVVRWNRDDFERWKMAQSERVGK